MVDQTLFWLAGARPGACSTKRTIRRGVQLRSVSPGRTALQRRMALCPTRPMSPSMHSCAHREMGLVFLRCCSIASLACCSRPRARRSKISLATVVVLFLCRNCRERALVQRRVSVVEGVDVNRDGLVKMKDFRLASCAVAERFIVIINLSDCPAAAAGELAAKSLSSLALVDTMFGIRGVIEQNAGQDVRGFRNELLRFFRAWRCRF